MDQPWLRQELDDLKRTAEALTHQGHPLGRRMRRHYQGIVGALMAPSPGPASHCVVCGADLPLPTRKGGRQRKYCKRRCQQYAMRHPELYKISKYTRAS